MLLYFQIEYKTYFGQQVMLTGTHPSLGNGDRDKAVTMNLIEPETGLWMFSINAEPGKAFTYRYFIREDNKPLALEEWGPDRKYSDDGSSCSSRLQVDFWRSMADPDYALLSSAFRRAIFRNNYRHPVPRRKRKPEKKSITLRFKPVVSRIKEGHYISVCGNAEALGMWHEERSLDLGNPVHPVWEGDVVLKSQDFPVYYKYLIKNSSGSAEFWEKSSERVIYLPEEFTPDVIEINDEKFDYPRFPWKGAGVAIPVFSLRRKNGAGIGEFSDLKLLVDWACKSGMKLIQILPVNDTVATHTWQDSYPYAAISVFALHPVYIDLSKMAALTSDITARIIRSQAKYLNTLDKIDYEAVMVLKSRFFKLAYDQEKEQFLQDENFKDFFTKNSFWLKPYAAFSYLRDLFNTADFNRWGDFSTPSEEILDQLTSQDAPHFDDIAVHYFIQFHAHLQLSDAADYARSKGIALKGDIPIGIYRNSVDAWLYPNLFNMDRQAGAPPDDFSPIGQNWRFPTYNWEEMAHDNYSWWQLRLKQMATYFDAFRIDHILGFFRIWEIPDDQVEGLMGYFNPSIPYTSEELRIAGLRFDQERLCKPYIRDHFLKERFGDLTERVKKEFLDETAPGCYALKKDFATQRAVEKFLTPGPDATPEERNQAQSLKKGLFSLISEVIFLEAPDSGGNGWFPGNGMHFTNSYRELDFQSRQVLNHLYTEYFYRRNEEFWKAKSLSKLPAIKNATEMLLCGEDLGMVPACVPHVMSNLGILSLEVQRMPKNPATEFGNPSEYPYLSVATPSSHDTSTIRGWWEENQAKTRRFFNEILGNPGEPPATCEPRIVEQIINQHLFCPSMWAVFPIQDLLGTDESLRLSDPHAERINQPANPNHYWCYRMHVDLEQLMDHEEFNAKIYSMIENSGRYEIY